MREKVSTLIPAAALQVISNRGSYILGLSVFSEFFAQNQSPKELFFLFSFCGNWLTSRSAATFRAGVLKSIEFQPSLSEYHIHWKEERKPERGLVYMLFLKQQHSRNCVGKQSHLQGKLVSLVRTRMGVSNARSCAIQQHKGRSRQTLCCQC